MAAGLGSRFGQGIKQLEPVGLNNEIIMDYSIHGVIKAGFKKFFENIEGEELTKEYLLPIYIGELLKEKRISVKVLETNDKWFGITYKEDKDLVVNSFKELIEKGVYPVNLFEDLL